MHDIQAKMNNLSLSAQKVRLVIDMVRGKSANEALEILRFVNKRAALPVQKLVASAVANAEENFGVSRDDLFVAKITADEAPTRKWRRFGARGRFKPGTASQFTRDSHLARARSLKENFMGRKVHPIGFRLGINQPWGGRWFAEGNTYRQQLHQDFAIRTLLLGKLSKGGWAASEKVRELRKQMPDAVKDGKAGISESMWNALQVKSAFQFTPPNLVF